MGELLNILAMLAAAALLIVVLFVILRGNLAQFFASRAQSRRPPAYGQERPPDCPRCQSRMEVYQQACLVCGWPAPVGVGADRRAALMALRTHLDRFAGLGLLDPETHAGILRAINSEARRLEAAHASPPARETLPEQVDESIELEPIELEPVEQEAVPLEAIKLEPIGESSAAASVGGEAAQPPVPPPGPRRPAERVREYVGKRQAAAALATTEDREQTEPPAAPRREAAARLLAAFMEEKNIRWGELLGGLLIVGCSIALVISFWSEIAARPRLKFVLLGGVTAALFGIGLYTNRRWNLHTTSRGVLVIASLLVPLNFLAIAAFTQETPPSDFVSLAGEIGSLALFAALVYSAGQILTPGAAPWLTAGILFPCLMQLVVRRYAEPALAGTMLYALAAAPIASYLGTFLPLVRRQSDALGPAESELAGADPAADSPAATTEPPASVGAPSLNAASPPLLSLSEPAAHRLLIFLGLVSASSLLPLVLLLYMVPPPYATLQRLAPLVAIAGFPALAAGLLLWRRMTDRALTGLQTAGLSIAALGAMAMVAAVALAWPQPATLLPTALLTALVLYVVGWRWELPAAYVPAGLVAAIAWLVAFHLALGYAGRGEITWHLPSSEPMQSALLSAVSGHALLFPVILLGALAAWLWRTGRRDVARMHALPPAIIAAVSLGLVAWFGFARFGDPHYATWTLAFYALAALAAAVVIDRPITAWIASVLLLATLVQGIVYRFGPVWQLSLPWHVAILTHASLAGLLAAATLFRPARLHFHGRHGLARSALATSVVAAGWLALVVMRIPATQLASYSLWLAAVWCGLAMLMVWPAVFSASQWAILVAIFWSVVAWAQAGPWYLESSVAWLQPRLLATLGIAVAGYCVALALLRAALGERARRDSEYVFDRPPPRWIAASQRLLNPPWPAVDRVAEAAIVVLLVGLAIYAVAPGVAQELALQQTPRQIPAAPREVPPLTEFEFAGIPHRDAAGRPVWLLAAAAAFVLGVNFWQRRDRDHAQALMLVAATVCPLVAVHWASEVAVASALCWAAAAFLAVVSIFYWLIVRRRQAAVPSLAGHARNFAVALVILTHVVLAGYVAFAALGRADLISLQGARLIPYIGAWTVVTIFAWIFAPQAAAALARPTERDATSRPPAPGASREIVAFLCLAPLVMLLLYVVVRVLEQYPIVGPEPGTWFHRIGLDVGYGAPLALVALLLAGHAFHGRSSRFAFAAGLAFHAAATVVVLLRTARGGAPTDAAAWLSVAQINAIVAAGGALIWSAALAWQRGRAEAAEQTDRPPLLRTQVLFAAALSALFLVPATVSLVRQPLLVPWITAAWSVAALVVLSALTAAHWDVGNWLAYRTLLVGCVAAAWLLPVVVRASPRSAHSADPHSLAFTTAAPFPWSALSVRWFAIAATLLALRAVTGGPANLWWVVAALLALSARNLWIAWSERDVAATWLTAVHLHLATSIWWLQAGNQLTGTSGIGMAFEFLWVNVLAAAAMTVVSLLLIRVRPPLARPREVATADARRFAPLVGRPGWQAPRGLPFHRPAVWLSAAVLLLATGAGLLADLAGSQIPASLPLAWAAWLSAAAAALAVVWDPAARWPVARLYVYGLLAVGLYLDGLNFRAPMFHWALANALAAYALATSYLWSRRDDIRPALARWGWPLAADPAAAAAAGAFAAAPPAAGSPAAAESPASQRRDAQRPPDLHPAAAPLRDEPLAGQSWLVAANSGLAVAVILLVAHVQLVMPAFGHRMIAAYAVGAVALAIALLARGAVRSPLQYISLVVGVLFAVAFGWAFLRPDFPAPLLHRLVVSVAALAAALLPGRDPLGLSERGRTLYVYSAEGLAALLFLHIRVTLPWLFRGWFLQFWPLVVMLLAFVGVGLGEVFQRRRQRVLAEPLETTGALLPLLPALGFWVMSRQVHYSLLLLSAGVLYASLSVLRGSFLYAILAALAANGSLWYLLATREGLSFLEHPQLWLIPPALCVLVAAHLNRRRLTPQQSAAIRYAAAIVIYVSSTADVFLHGVADAPWLPAVLAGLSILGVFAGILLRVRAFLYLGTSFLVVALMTVIWHAAFNQQQDWIIWVAGIIAGMLILALFGLFEKRRDDVLRVVEDLKKWQA